MYTCNSTGSPIRIAQLIVAIEGGLGSDIISSLSRDILLGLLSLHVYTATFRVAAIHVYKIGLRLNWF